LFSCIVRSFLRCPVISRTVIYNYFSIPSWKPVEVPFASSLTTVTVILLDDVSHLTPFREVIAGRSQVVRRKLLIKAIDVIIRIL
jgi:hypothetical protein